MLQVIKRDGTVVDYNNSKIALAITKCGTQKTNVTTVVDAVERLIMLHLRNCSVDKYVSVRETNTISVEQIQDYVEMSLMVLGELESAKHYILYRENHARMRDSRPVPDNIRAAFADAKQYFPTPLQEFQFFDKYSRFNYELGRRETWVETVRRAVKQLHAFAAPYADLGSELYLELERAMLEMRVTPSMRLYSMAGAPAERDNTTIYNCSYMPVQDLEAFKEALLITMAGCGVGFSVEDQYISKLPSVGKQKDNQGSVRSHIHVVDDSAEGWGRALVDGLYTWIEGYDVEFDFSNVRKAGAILKTKGGRASGPGPLKQLLEYTHDKMLARQGMQLRSIDAHDIMCAVGNAAVAGGVRRSAMISLFDEEDNEMIEAKSDGFEIENSVRWNANNSFVWKDQSQVRYIERFMRMVKIGRGEPGLFSRVAAQDLVPLRRNKLNSRDTQYGVNPCGEIILLPWQFCNLSAVVLRKDDTRDTLMDKARLAAIIGTIQSLATHFPSLRAQWAENCKLERLLGVDITGQQDNPMLLSRDVLQSAQRVVRETNAEYAGLLGINVSAATTCVKPSGNTSTLVNCASGLHARWAPYYIRNVRVGATSPIAKVLQDAGVPLSPENGDDPVNPNTWVVSFPTKSPDGAVTRNDMSAVQQCEWWLHNKINWTEHNPSVTITYTQDEVLPLMHWVWQHKDVIGGMAFLPKSEAKYAQLPYIEITREEYEKRVAEFPDIDFSKVFRYEEDDQTKAAQELACLSGYCSVDDLPGV